MLDIVLPSPVEPIDIANDQGIRFFIKRDDCIHPIVSGNKWRKLKYQLKDSLDMGIYTVVTFGGAFSNHIVATAAACQLKGMQSVGIIRGESTSAANPSLMQARTFGMELHFVSRSDYRLKEGSEAVQSILEAYPDATLIQEGGRHQRAMPGVGEVISELTNQCDDRIDYLMCAVGTGTTFAGLAQSFSGELLGINVLKNEAVEDEICALMGVEELEGRQRILNAYHRGGYAKFDDELLQAMTTFYAKHGIKTDIIYTAKLIVAVQDLLQKRYFKDQSTVVLYHSGGLQGNEGMNYRFPGLIEF